MKETVRRRTFISSLAIGGLLPRESRGQPAWVPVTAKVREAVFLVNADGSESALSSREGYFYRTTDGSDIRYTQRVIGGTPQGPGRAFLRDSTTRASYNLYYGAKKALAEKWKQATRNRLPEPQSNVVRGRQVVNGLSCVGTVLRVPGLGREGIAWKSIEYDLMVKVDYTMAEGSRSIHSVLELYDIQIGVEPPVGAVAVPRDFQVLEEAASTGSCQSSVPPADCHGIR